MEGVWVRRAVDVVVMVKTKTKIWVLVKKTKLSYEAGE